MQNAPDRPLTVGSRLIALLFGTIYLLVLAEIFVALRGGLYWGTVGAVCAGALVIMVSLGWFCMKFVRHGGERRVRLSTLLGLFVPIAIYLAAIGWLLRGAGPPGPFELFYVTTVLAGFAAVTTVVLLWYAEALVWLGHRLARLRGSTFTDGADAARRPNRPVLDHLQMRHGHFVFESGHHSDLWLDLERLCLRPDAIRPFAAELAERLAGYRVDAVCGPLVEGAFVAMMVAEELGVDFCYALRIEHPEKPGLFPVEYRVPAVLRERLRGQRVALVNDVVSAGSAVRGAAADLQACWAKLVGIACLATLGDAAAQIAQQYGVPLFRLDSRDVHLWTPEECPLCQNGVAVSD